MSNYVAEYNARVRRINKCVARQRVLAQQSTLGELGKKPKLTKAQKAEQKALKKVEEKERKALLALTSKKDRKKLAKQGKKARKQLKNASGFIGDLNDTKPLTLPLTDAEEQFRAASVAGNFSAMDAMAPFGHTAWRKKIRLGKYRFQIQNGKPVYVPWSESDIDAFLAGPWLQRDPTTGVARLIHPRRKDKADFVKKKNQMLKDQSTAAKKFPNTDMRHVGNITVGDYIFPASLDSTWVKIRKPVMVAVAVVAAVYLGPAALEAIKGAYAGAGAGAGAGAAGTAAGTTAGAGAAEATLGAKIFAGAKTLTDYANNARTIKAIASGEAPPPPIGVTGNSFGEWAFDVAKKEAMDEYGRRLTEQEEKDIRREIAQLQAQLAPYVKDAPLEPSPELPQELKNIQAIEQKRADDLQKYLLPAAIVAGALLIGG